MDDGYGYLSLRGSDDPRIGGQVGLLVGDGLGVPFEFTPSERIPTKHLIEMKLPIGFPRAHVGVPNGTWSDDGGQALCLLVSVLGCGKFSLTDFSDRLVRWLSGGYMSVAGDVFDSGIQTAQALRLLREGVPSHESGGKDDHDCGRCLHGASRVRP